MPDSLPGQQPSRYDLAKNIAFLPESGVAFWSFMCCLTLCACLCAEYFLTSAGREQSRQMLSAMRARAESLVWALEGGARFFRQKDNAPLRELLTEMARQPGIAWIAITDEKGKILQDSNPRLDGAILYTEGELAQLLPDSELQGRFSPDDPGIFETWKLFRPERLAKKGRSQKEQRPYFIFVALNAAAFQENLEEYLQKQRLIATILISGSLCLLTMLFYVYNFRLSRHKLAAAEALALEVIANYPGGILLTDMEGNVILANGRAREFLGLDMASAGLLDLPSYDWKGLLGELAVGNSVLERELLLPEAGARPRPLSLSATSIVNGDKQQALLIFRDMTEIRQLRRTLSHSRKLSATGKLAAGVAHEIRNPLSSIRGYAHYLLGRLEEDPLGKATAELLVDETRRINSVLEDLLAFSRPPRLNLEENSLEAIVQKAWRLAKPDSDSKKIELQLELPEKKPECWPLTDADRLLQALFNLLLNALQFTPEGGKVWLGLRHASESASAQGGWLISVKDSGPGVPEKLLSQIFNPYFTTREQGTGLGLALARQIVENHGGEISVSSAPGKGALFTIFLPDLIIS